MSAQIGECVKCGANKLIMPLHGDKGGPLTCLHCGIAWHAEHGRRRKAGRIVVKAIKAFLAAGGKFNDIDRLSLAASGIPLSSWEADTVGADVGDITTKLLEATIRLTHPDRHPQERQGEAHRVTQELLALKPFVFPAKKWNPDPIPFVPPRNDSVKGTHAEVKKPSPPEYPCELCADTVPHFYCKACRAKWESIYQKEREERNAKQRAAYARRRELKRYWRGPRECSSCGAEFKSKRKDASFCSAVCRQKAHRQRVTDKKKLPREELAIRYAEAAA